MLAGICGIEVERVQGDAPDRKGGFHGSTPLEGEVWVLGVDLEFLAYTALGIGLELRGILTR